MKYNVVLILSVLVITCSSGQVLKKGGYRTAAEAKNNLPSIEYQFVVEKRTQGDIMMNGGNDYKISSLNPAMTKKILKKEMWGVFNGDTLFINGRITTGLNWYSKVEALGLYSYLNAAFPVDPKMQKILGISHETIGYMFGAIGGAIQGARIAKMRVPILLNIETGRMLLLNEKNMISFLSNFPSIKDQYEKEPIREGPEIWIKYTQKINAALE